MTAAMPYPVRALSPLLVGDLEAALLGLVGDGHRLGGPVHPAAGRPSGRVSLDLDEGLAHRAMEAGGLELTDEEATPLADLVDPELTPAEGEQAVVLTGTLRARRRRESGAGAAYRLEPLDQGPDWGAVLVLGRPEVAADADTVGALAALSSVERPLMVAVPDHPASTDGVPTSTMLAIAREIAGRFPAALVRTLPLRWRGPGSDEVLCEALAALLDARVHVLRPDAQPGGAQWAQSRSLLESAREDVLLDDVSPAAAAALRRWRPARPRRGVVMVFSGLSGSGKSTVARAVAEALEEDGRRTVSLLDGDVVRQLLSSGLGFDRESRLTNLRRIGWVGAQVAHHGGLAICAPIAPYASIRAEMRAMAESVGDFLLIHISTPLAECERRDLKGLYAKARAGLIPEFTGISDPYDVPEDADLRIDTSSVSVEEATEQVLALLHSGGWLPEPSHEGPFG